MRQNSTAPDATLPRPTPRLSGSGSQVSPEHVQQGAPFQEAPDLLCDLIVHSVRLLDASRAVEDGWVATRDSRIIASGTGTSWHRYAARDVVDGNGGILVPGFIDLHCHGAGRGSFDGNPNDILNALAVYRSHGTTRSVLSLASAPIDELCSSLSTIANLTDTNSTILGSHLEGPFLSTASCGTHHQEYLVQPTSTAVARLLRAARGTLRQVTIAPELPGALEAIEQFVAAGVLVAVGHTEADVAQTRKAFARGATLVTHAFNAMAETRHRAPGPVVAAFGERRAFLEMILDGIHVNPAVAKFAFDAAPGRIVLVTAAKAATGFKDRNRRLRSVDVAVDAGRVPLTETDPIVRSIFTQDTALRKAVTLLNLSPETAVEALTSTPAQIIGRRDFGSVATGKRADIVLLDQEYKVLAVWADGCAQPLPASRHVVKPE